ncbi:hypothetical protein [Kribbella sindirgiensis]|uniref:Uncharacterized protein n=1 Tax=Kribbella sindirgiensis TaxID=1124744 RepID=A0A4V2M3L3_9ACTN|nr:hypothetical protein [Kribbella sindirgiensis]TCC32522.1 hypothetical protein E0H50_20355 [Kribbella sindirgiensis]
MKQRGDGQWSGHHDITYAAVARLYEQMAGPDGTIRGLRLEEYAEALDRAQAHQDRPLGAGVIENYNGSGKSMPYAGPGPTAHSAYVNPNAQREHFMADPYRKGLDNLETNTEYIYDQLAQASGPDEFRHLGAAAHALQDSYSGAHAWRADSVYDGDPTAPVVSLHVFTPMHAMGIDDGKNTHADEFDTPPATSGSVRAATEATYRMLRSYELNRDLAPDAADRARRNDLAPMLRPSPSGVTVNWYPSREWTLERNRRLALEHGVLQPGPEAAEIARLTGILAPNSTAGTAPVNPPDRRPGGVSRGITSEGVGRDG